MRQCLNPKTGLAWKLQVLTLPSSLTSMWTWLILKFSPVNQRLEFDGLKAPYSSNFLVISFHLKSWIRKQKDPACPVAKGVKCWHRNSGLYVGTCDYSTIIMIHQKNKFPCWLHIHTPQPFPLTTFTSWSRNSLKVEWGCGWSGKEGGEGVGSVLNLEEIFGSSFSCSFIPPTVLLFFLAECLIILTRQKVISQNSYHHSFSSIISSVKTFSYIHKWWLNSLNKLKRNQN